MTQGDRWIIVTNWDRFQHPDVLRSDSPPAWIRAYTKLLHNPDFERLTYLQRGILLTIWLEFGSSDGQLTVTALSRRGPTVATTGPNPGQERVRTRSLEALVEAGFIEVSASRPLAISKQHASPEKRREEKNPPTPLTGTNRNNGRPRKPEEVPTMIDVVTACQHFIEGRAWDETFDEHAIREEFGRIERARRTVGFITEGQMQGLLEQWAATRQDRHGIPANLGAA